MMDYALMPPPPVVALRCRPVFGCAIPAEAARRSARDKHCPQLGWASGIARSIGFGFVATAHAR